VSFGLNPGGPVRCSTSVFLHECVKGRVRHRDRATPRRSSRWQRIPDEQRAVALDPGVRPAAGMVYGPAAAADGRCSRASRRRHRGKSRAAELAALPLFERLERRIIDGDRNGLAEGPRTPPLKQRPALQIINDTLLSGMRTVGELFGSGQMQLPFVLQSAEVMKGVGGAPRTPHMERSEGDTG